MRKHGFADPTADVITECRWKGSPKSTKVHGAECLWSKDQDRPVARGETNPCGEPRLIHANMPSSARVAIQRTGGHGEILTLRSRCRGNRGRPRSAGYRRSRRHRRHGEGSFRDRSSISASNRICSPDLIPGDVGHGSSGRPASFGIIDFKPAPEFNPEWMRLIRGKWEISGGSRRITDDRVARLVKTSCQLQLLVDKDAAKVEDLGKRGRMCMK